METVRKGDHVTSPILAGVASRLRAWLVSEAYPLWWEAGADRAGGGFHDALDLAGVPTGDRKRARVQARQAYCFAAGPSFGWDGPSLEAMRHGLDFLERRHRRPDGLYRAAADTERTDLYDQAFVIRVLRRRAGRRANGLGAGRGPAGQPPRHPFGGYRSLAREGLGGQSQHAPLRGGPGLDGGWPRGAVADRRPRSGAAGSGAPDRPLQRCARREFRTTMARPAPARPAHRTGTSVRMGVAVDALERAFRGRGGSDHRVAPDRGRGADRS